MQPLAYRPCAPRQLLTPKRFRRFRNRKLWGNAAPYIYAVSGAAAYATIPNSENASLFSAVSFPGAVLHEIGGNTWLTRGRSYNHSCSETTPVVSRNSAILSSLELQYMALQILPSVFRDLIPVSPFEAMRPSSVTATRALPAERWFRSP